MSSGIAACGPVLSAAPMISVVIPVESDEPALIDTLAALVPAAADGLVRDLVLAAAGGTEFLRQVADAAGCASPFTGERRASPAAWLGDMKGPGCWSLVAGLRARRRLDGRGRRLRRECRAWLRGSRLLLSARRASCSSGVQVGELARERCWSSPPPPWVLGRRPQWRHRPAVWTSRRAVEPHL